MSTVGSVCCRGVPNAVRGVSPTGLLLGTARGMREEKGELVEVHSREERGEDHNILSNHQFHHVCNAQLHNYASLGFCLSAFLPAEDFMMDRFM